MSSNHAQANPTDTPVNDAWENFDEVFRGFLHRRNLNENLERIYPEDNSEERVENTVTIGNGTLIVDPDDDLPSELDFNIWEEFLRSCNHVRRSPRDGARHPTQMQSRVRQKLPQALAGEWKHDVPTLSRKRLYSINVGDSNNNNNTTSTHLDLSNTVSHPRSDIIWPNLPRRDPGILRNGAFREVKPSIQE